MLTAPTTTFTFDNARKTRLTNGSLLRIAFDAILVPASLATALLVVTGVDTNQLLTPANLLAFVLSAVLSVCIHAIAGVYAHDPDELLSIKLKRLFTSNGALFLLLGTLWLAAQTVSPRSGSSLRGLSVVASLGLAFVLSSAMLAAARYASTVIRDEAIPFVPLNLAATRPDLNHVLVIGGAGYIGSSLVRSLLDGGRRVTVLDALHYGTEPLLPVLDHPRFTLIREDFRHIEAVTRAMTGVGSVVHLGGLVGDPACAFDADLTVDVNITATKVIGEIAKACGVRRFIFASSCSVYGANDDIVDETSSFNPQSLYAQSKVASEAVLLPLSDDAFAVTCLRFATVYGFSGRTRFDLVANLLCAKAVRDGVITVFGEDQWRPFVHVDDVAKGVRLALDAPLGAVGGECFNVGSDGQNYTLGQLARLIKDRVPNAEIVVENDVPDKRNYRVSFAKIQDRLGYRPDWTLEQGLDQVIGIVRSNRVGHYTNATYSNLLSLKERGAASFAPFRISGWESELMSLPRIATPSAVADHHFAAN